jgi:hypothetical protein
MLATLCRPNSKNEKEGLKLSLIGRLKSTKKDLDRSVTARSKGTLAFVFNKALWGVGAWAEGRRQKAAKWASPIWIVRLPAAPLAHDDRLRRGDFCAARPYLNRPRLTSSPENRGPTGERRRHGEQPEIEKGQRPKPLKPTPIGDEWEGEGSRIRVIG